MTSHLLRLVPTGLLALTFLSAEAQNVRLNAYGGYTFQDRFPMGGTYNGFNYSEGRLEDGAHYGASIEFDIRPRKALEISYQNQMTNAYLSGTFPVEKGPYNVSLNYIMLGGVGYAPFSQKVSGFGGLMLGCAYMTGSSSATKFAWGGRLGLKIDFSERVGLKLGAQLLSPVQGAGGGLYFGTGGAGAGVSTYSTIYQFGFTGGLVFTLPRGGSAPAPKSRAYAPPPPAAQPGMPPPPAPGQPPR
ncbi:MAG: hypothetical protein JNM31_14955 [Flavobacteriales bacterium]|nr:hypothetical protein [Flavobacteriales bacterium]